jgi:hypothetical protein
VLAFVDRIHHQVADTGIAPDPRGALLALAVRALPCHLALILDIGRRHPEGIEMRGDADARPALVGHQAVDQAYDIGLRKRQAGE